MILTSTETFFDDYASKIWCKWEGAHPMFHMDIREEWCVSTYKKNLGRMALIKNHLKSRGCSKAFVCIEEDHKMEKFEEMFGFSPIARIDGKVYFVQEF